MADYQPLWEPIKKVIKRAAMPFIADGFEIKFSRLSKKSGILGAGELVVEKMLGGKDR
jgi:hypothetical protein